MTPTKRHMEMARECLSKGLKSHWKRVQPCGVFAEGVEIKTDYVEVFQEFCNTLARLEAETVERCARIAEEEMGTDDSKVNQTAVRIVTAIRNEEGEKGEADES